MQERGVWQDKDKLKAAHSCIAYTWLRCSLSLLKLDRLHSKILTDAENMQKHSYISGVEQRLGVVLYASPYLRVATIAQ